MIGARPRSRMMEMPKTHKSDDRAEQEKQGSFKKMASTRWNKEQKPKRHIHIFFSTETITPKSYPVALKSPKRTKSEIYLK